MQQIVQKHRLGCGVAVTAAVLDISYKKALLLFEEGEYKVKKTGVICREIVGALEKYTVEKYIYRYVKDHLRDSLKEEKVITFMRRSSKYPAGHFVVRDKNGWMDPWINFPKYPRKSGIRVKLPVQSIYVIFKEEI